MAKVSIVIPARNEQFLTPTVNDIFAKATGDVEVIAILDGYWPDPLPEPNDNLTIIHRGVPYGMRGGINAGVAVAKGKYIMKCDAHCMFDEGFDEKLQEDCDEDWVVVPRRKSLNAELWEVIPKAPYNHMFMSFPSQPGDFGGAGYHGKVWKARDRDPVYNQEPIFDLLSFQGSGWFMHRDYFYFLELMDEKNFGHFWQEAQEIGIKCWYSGGYVKRNTKTWYAHLHKGKKYGRGYFLDKRSLRQPVKYTNNWIPNPDWDKQAEGRDLKWLVEHFWPIPSWPDNWEQELREKGVLK